MDNLIISQVVPAKVSVWLGNGNDSSGIPFLESWFDSLDRLGDFFFQGWSSNVYRECYLGLLLVPQIYRNHAKVYYVNEATEIGDEEIASFFAFNPDHLQQFCNDVGLDKPIRRNVIIQQAV